MAKVPENLRLVADKVHADGKPHTETVRTLLSWFGAQRRGNLVIRQIRSALRRVNLITQPDFELTFIDGRIKLIPAPAEQVKTLVWGKPISSTTVEKSEAPSSLVVVGGSIPDPVPRIGMLAAANTKPISVTRDSEVCEAVTLMLMHDYSQLPVMQNDRNVDGLISWKSIGAARALNKECMHVRQCMEGVEILGSDIPLFNAIEVIAAKDVVLVRNSERRIVGLVTTSDISLQFGALAEPFLLLGEIENHIRRLIDGKYPLDTLIAARDPSDSKREIENVSDLTFGEYIRLLENPENWNRLSFNLCRPTFMNQLGEVRRIRNDVMHFHPDGISDDDLELLRDMVKFMQAL